MTDKAFDIKVPEAMGTAEAVITMGMVASKAPLYASEAFGELWPRIIAAASQQQFVIFYRKGSVVPIGFTTYAFFSDEVAADFASRSRALTARDYHSGANVWLIDLVALEEGPAIIRWLRRVFFNGVYLQWTRVKDGQVVGQRHTIGGYTNVAR